MHGTVERQRRNDGIHTRAVLKASIDHRARLVDAAADHAHDPFDDAQQVSIVLKYRVGFLEPAVSFDVNLVVAVHENVRDLGIRKQRLQWTQPEDLVQHVDDERIALEQAERSPVALAIQEIADQAPDLGFSVLSFHASQPLEVEPAEELLVNATFEGLVLRIPDVSRRRERHVAVSGLRFG